jgi:hypothetical protein
MREIRGSNLDILPAILNDRLRKTRHSLQMNADIVGRRLKERIDLALPLVLSGLPSLSL